jgi:hypothetical protein
MLTSSKMDAAVRVLEAGMLGFLLVLGMFQGKR